jgi:hypothetical protein
LEPFWLKFHQKCHRQFIKKRWRKTQEIYNKRFPKWS